MFGALNSAIGKAIGLIKAPKANIIGKLFERSNLVYMFIVLHKRRKDNTMRQINSNTVLEPGTQVRIVGSGAAKLGTVVSGETVRESTGRGWICSHVIRTTKEHRRISGALTGWVDVDPTERNVNYSFIYIE